MILLTVFIYIAQALLRHLSDNVPTHITSTVCLCQRTLSRYCASAFIPHIMCL